MLGLKKSPYRASKVPNYTWNLLDVGIFMNIYVNFNSIWLAQRCPPQSLIAVSVGSLLSCITSQTGGGLNVIKIKTGGDL